MVSSNYKILKGKADISSGEKVIEAKKNNINVYQNGLMSKINKIKYFVPYLVKA